MYWILAYLALVMLAVGIELAKHGERKTGEHNAWLSIVSAALVLWLLYMGDAFHALLALN